MTLSQFGNVIPVTGPNIGFAGTVSRAGDPLITAKPVLSTAAANVNFGDPVVVVPTAGGGDSFQQVADFITQGGTFTAAKFAGVAVRELKTSLTYPITPGSPQSGSYSANQLCEALVRGTIAVKVNVGAPASQGTVYVRTTLNGAIPAGVVGGFEAAADGGNTVVLTGVVFKNGRLDANNVAEITLETRQSA